MSWYLADASEVIDQFATVSGLAELREASSHLATLADFFRDGETRNVPTCISQLAEVRGGEDVMKTATGLAAMMKGKIEVFITQGFGETVEHKSSESLKHPKHAEKLEPIRADAKTVLAKFFRTQKRELVKEIKPDLEALAALSESAALVNPRFKEATDDEAKKAAAGALPKLLPISVTSGMSTDYSKALTAAMEAGYDTLAGDIGTDKEIGEDVVKRYLADHSLSKLTGDFEDTTIDRLRNALADAYQKGGDYEALVKAVQSEYEGFSDTRAELIAQTEMNNAYNQGRKALGLDLGFNEKSWSTDGPAPCPECIGNVLDGWIGMEESFSSGDMEPTAHPGCFCSLDIRLNPHANE